MNLSFWCSHLNKCWVLINTLNRGGIVIEVEAFGIHNSGSDAVRVKEGKWNWRALIIYIDHYVFITTVIHNA